MYTEMINISTTVKKKRNKTSVNEYYVIGRAISNVKVEIRMNLDSRIST